MAKNYTIVMDQDGASMNGCTIYLPKKSKGILVTANDVTVSNCTIVRTKKAKVFSPGTIKIKGKIKFVKLQD